MPELKIHKNNVTQSPNMLNPHYFYIIFIFDRKIQEAYSIKNLNPETIPVSIP